MKDFSSVTHNCQYETEEAGCCGINPVLQTTWSHCGQWWTQFGGRSGDLTSCFAQTEELARWCGVVASFILGCGLPAAHWSTHSLVCMIYFLPCYVFYYIGCAIGAPLSTCLFLPGPAHRLHDCVGVVLHASQSLTPYDTSRWSKCLRSSLLGETVFVRVGTLCANNTWVHFRPIGWQELLCFVRRTLVGVRSLYFYSWVWAV